MGKKIGEKVFSEKSIKILSTNHNSNSKESLRLYILLQIVNKQYEAFNNVVLHKTLKHDCITPKKTFQ